MVLGKPLDNPWDESPVVVPDFTSVPVSPAESISLESAQASECAQATGSSKSQMDDLTLVKTYVEGFIHRQPLMLCNSNLRTEPLFGSVQLLSKKEGVVSTARFQDPPLSALVKYSSPYWSLVHQALVEKSFFPSSDPAAKTCYRYQHRPIPDGYEIQCTLAKELWRVCWSRGHSSRYGIPMDLLIFSRGPTGRHETWYPIRGMECLNGRLVVKLLGGEESYDSDDMVVWLRKTAGPSLRKTSGKRPMRPDLRNYVRPQDEFF
jgi:hypothetical protein